MLSLFAAITKHSIAIIAQQTSNYGDYGLKQRNRQIQSAYKCTKLNMHSNNMMEIGGWIKYGF